jgi:hypothetical protein
MSFIESQEERRARYKRLAIAAAAAAARTQVPEVRTAYMLMAESWSDMAEADAPDANPPEAPPGSLDAGQSPRTGSDDPQPENH